MVCEAFEGGVFAYISQLCNDMADSFSVYLAYSFRPRTPQNYNQFFDTRVQLIQVKSWNEKSIMNPINDMKVVKELRTIVAYIQPDIIHLHSSIAGGIGRIAFNGKKIPVVYTPHGYAHILMEPSIKTRLYGILEKILGKRNCITLTCCESEDEVAKTLCKKTTYIETGINLKDLGNSLDGIIPEKNEMFTVFTLGRACPQKQPAIFNRIAQLVPEAKFIWIGNGELEGELTNCEVTGWKPRKEALSMAKGADAFILCSRGEAIAMSLIENMFLKKLVLVSNTMGNKSVIQDGVNGFICETAEEYAERIRTAMKEFPRELTERAYQDVLDIYNTEIMKKKFVEFYSQL